MSNETITDVRTELFATLRGLTDKEHPMDIERAKVVADVAQTIINSAKVEVEHMKIAGGKGSGFIPDTRPRLPGRTPRAITSETAGGTKTVTQLPGGTVTQHRMRG